MDIFIIELNSLKNGQHQMQHDAKPNQPILSGKKIMKIFCQSISGLKALVVML